MNLMNLLIILLAFLLTIGILVAIHEFGHYWVARKLGVKVLRFSIGFGKPIWSKTAGVDRTEYVIGSIPLGGYVRMLDGREDDVSPEDQHRAFNHQNVWKRIAIVAAGPIANFILALLLYALIFMTGNPAMSPLVQANPDTPAAQAGILPGDKIVAINQQSVSSWEEARMRLLSEYLKSPILSLQVEPREGGLAERRLDLSSAQLLKEEGDFLNNSGLRFWSPELVIILGDLRPDSPAQRAGLQTGDQVLSMDGMTPPNAESFISYIQQRPEQSIEISVKRADGQHMVSVVPERDVDANGQERGLIGAFLGETIPSHIREEIQFTQYFGPINSLALGAEKTWQNSVMTLKLLGRMLTGEVSLKNISGPVTIARFSGETVVAGLPYYLGFLAIVSISLGILNLLPIPMLDGGRLLYYFVEIIKGSPVSERTEAFGMRIGVAVIAGIMVLALYNDFMRLFN